jgi:hypothetical protein
LERVSITARALVGVLFVLALVRAALYVAYVVDKIGNPFDAYFLESAMVHLAWRAQHGVQLYPQWQHYPHVSNFFSPLSFVIIGSLGRATGTDLAGLYLIGRAVTVASVLLTTLVLGLVVSRRCGTPAALLAMALSLGGDPLFHCGVMTRPDALAEALGLTGFFLASGQRSMTRAIGGVLLYFAAMTKQTALVYLVAAVLGLWLEARRNHAWRILIGVTSALFVTILAVRFSIEPNFVVSLLGESQMPFDIESWSRTVMTIAWIDSELFVLTIAGIFFWSRGPKREPMPAALAALLLASSLLTAAKRGSAENYFLGMRSVAALAAGTLWHNLSTSGSRSRLWEKVTLLAVIGGMPLSMMNAEYFRQNARREALFRGSVAGKASLNFHKRLFREAEDPRRPFLTDVGFLDIRQGERTVFGDPWKFKRMAENGQIDTTVIQKNIDDEYYDLIYCQKDLFSPDYETFEFGLPRALVERARRHYRFALFKYGLYVYARHGAREQGHALQLRGSSSP